MISETCVFDAGIAALGPASAWVRSFALASRFAPDRADDVDLCVHEVLANIIRHGYRHADGVVTVRLERRPEAVIVTISDAAPPFDPLDHPEPRSPTSIADASTGGYGIPIVRALATRLGYAREGGRNVLTLEFSAR